MRALFDSNKKERRGMDRFSRYPLQLDDDVTVPAVAYFNDELWEAFRQFYQAFAVQKCVDVAAFLREFRLPEKLRVASDRLFREVKERSNRKGQESGHMADLYFDNFSAILTPPSSKNTIVWKQLFQFVHGWEKKNNFYLHKSALFYCWATEYLLSGDYVNAFMRMHRALEEDNRRYDSTSILPTPTHRFISMRPKSDDVLYPMTLEMLRFVVEALDRYRKGTGKQLSFAEFRQHFFDEQHEILEDLQFFFLFTVLKLMKLSENFYTEGLADLKMAPMIFSNVIADLIVVSEELFRLVFQALVSSKQNLTFINYLQDIANAEGWTADQQHYHATISNARLTRDNFGEMVQHILRGIYRTKDNRRLEPMEAHLVLTYQLRNFSAHTIQSQQVLWERFPQILQSVLNTFFFGVELFAAKASSVGKHE